MGTLRATMERLEQILKDGRQLLQWQDSIRAFIQELAVLPNTGRVTIILNDTDDVDYHRGMELPVDLVRADLEKLGVATQLRVEETIRSFKMTG